MVARIRGDTIAHTREYAGGGSEIFSPAITPIAAAPVALAAAPGGQPGWGDVSGLFREALASLTGEGEKVYQGGKRRTLSDIAMQSVNAGMANTLNMPAAGIAYDEANRPVFNTMLGQQKAGILTGLGQTAAGMYGQNLGAQTSRYGVDVGAQTSRYGVDVGAGNDAAQRALQLYIDQMKNTIANRELSLKQPSQLGGTVSGFAR